MTTVKRNCDSPITFGNCDKNYNLEQNDAIQLVDMYSERGSYVL